MRELILASTLMDDERELLEEWLEECDDTDFEEYLRLKTDGGEKLEPDN